MKKAIRILLFIVVFLSILVAGALAYFNSKFPADIPVEEIKVEVTPDRIERGKYLAHNVSMCIDCHSERDFSKFSGPIVDGTFGKGGEIFSHENSGVPGTLFAKNITPYNLGKYTDGELFRVITTGITKDGTALFPLMPYGRFKDMAREDLYSIIAYLRSLPPIKNDVPERSLDFPMNLIVNTIPGNAGVVESIPSVSDTLEYGKYMANAAGCIDCHTQMVKGEFVKGMEFAGGFQFKLPNGDIVNSANITADMETGIGALTKENFIARFKTYDNLQAQHIAVKDHEKNTIMPWTKLAGMTEVDLGAIYTYLRTMPPVKNKVEVFRPAKIDL